MRSIEKSAAVIVLAISLALSICAQTQDSELAPTKGHPMLELDLRKFGYERYRNWHTYVDFTDANHVALAWLTPDDRRVAAKTGVLATTPAHLHVLLFDAHTGEKKGPQSYATPSHPVRFSGIRDGQFLTCTGNVLRSYSSNFALIREQILPNDLGCSDSTAGSGISPSRKRLLLSFPIPQPRGQPWPANDTLLNIDTFVPISTWTQEPTTVIGSISDDRVIGSCGRPGGTCIRAMGQSWQSFEPVPHDKNEGWSRPQFLNDSTLILPLGNELGVVTVNREVLFRPKPPEGLYFDRLATSVAGERFAVMEDRIRGPKSEALDMSFPSNDTVVVYSIPDKRSIYAVKVKGETPWQPWARHVNQIALSLDGMLLAIVSDHTLRVYRLPEKR